MYSDIKKIGYSIILHEICNEECLFCFQESTTRKKNIFKSDRDVYKHILFAYKSGFSIIRFTGGEPLIHKSILLYIAFAKKVGFSLIYIQTNGVQLSNMSFVNQLIDTGVNMFHISVHHYESEIHDTLVSLPHAFSKVLLGIKNLQELGIYTGIHIVINKYNYKELLKIIQFFASEGIINYVLIAPLFSGSMMKNHGEIAISYTEILTYIKECLDFFIPYASNYIYVVNIPACILGGYEKFIVGEINGITIEPNQEVNRYFGKKRQQNYFIDSCNHCIYKSKCFGIDKNYIQIYGSKEFSPVSHIIDRENCPSLNINAPMKLFCNYLLKKYSQKDSLGGILERIFFSPQYMKSQEIPVMKYCENFLSLPERLHTDIEMIVRDFDITQK